MEDQLLDMYNTREWCVNGWEDISDGYVLIWWEDSLLPDTELWRSYVEMHGAKIVKELRTRILVKWEVSIEPKENLNKN